MSISIWMMWQDHDRTEYNIIKFKWGEPYKYQSHDPGEKIDIWFKLNWSYYR